MLHWMQQVVKILLQFDKILTNCDSSKSDKPQFDSHSNGSSADVPRAMRIVLQRVKQASVRVENEVPEAGRERN